MEVVASGSVGGRMLCKGVDMASWISGGKSSKRVIPVAMRNGGNGSVRRRSDTVGQRDGGEGAVGAYVGGDALGIGLG